MIRFELSSQNCCELLFVVSDAVFLDEATKSHGVYRASADRQNSGCSER
jgi:hypothetical protein